MATTAGSDQYSSVGSVGSGSDTERKVVKSGFGLVVCMSADMSPKD